MLLNSKLDSVQESDSYLSLLSKVRRQKVKPEDYQQPRIIPNISPKNQVFDSGFNVEEFFMRIAKPLTSTFHQGAKVPLPMHLAQNSVSRIVKRSSGNSKDESRSVHKPFNTHVLSLHNLVASQQVGRPAIPSTPIVVETSKGRANNLNFGDKYWREVSPGLRYGGEGDIDIPIYIPQARPMQDDFPINHTVGVALGASSTKRSESKTVTANQPVRKVSGKYSGADYLFYEDTVTKKVKERNLRIKKEDKKQENDRREADLEQDILHHVDTPKSLALIVPHSRLSKMGSAASVTEAPAETKTSGGFKQLIDVQHFISERVMQVFLSNSLLPITEADCWQIFKMLMRKPIDHENFQVLNSDSISNIPKVFRFAGRFEYMIIDFDMNRILKGSLQILKNNWLKVTNDISMPSLRDLVYAACSQETEVAAVVLYVVLGPILR